MPAGDMPAGARGQAFQYPAGELITSSLSNKGNPTAFGQDNTFRVLEQNEVRIIDNKGNLLFSGTGPEAARQAVKIGENLSDTLGNKAGWTIQTGERTINPDGSVGATRFYDVANEKVNKSALSKIGDVLGTALPIAVGFIPGIGQLATGLQIAAGVGAGGVGAALRGDDILKGAVMGGLSSAGGKIVGDALRGAGMGLSANAARSIGSGLGTTTGGLVTGQDFGNALLGGVASGGLSYLGGEAFGKRGGTTTSGGGDTGSYGGGGGGDLGDIVVTAGVPRFTGALFPTSFADKAQLNSNETNPYQTGDFAVPTPAAVDSGLTQDNITVTARPTTITGSSTFAVGAPNINTNFSVPKDITDLAEQTTEEPIDDTIFVDAKPTPITGTSTFAVGAPNVNANFSVPEEIIVEAKKAADTGTSTLAVKPTVSDSGLTKDDIEVIAKKGTDTGSSTAAVGGPDVDPEFGEDIEVTAKKTDATKTGTPLVPTNLLDQIADPKVKEDLEKGKEDDAKKKLDVADYMRLLGLAVGLGGNLFGGGDGGKSPGKYSSTGRLSSTFTDKLPTPGQNGAFTVGGLGGTAADRTLAARPVTDWYRYGMGPAMDIPAGADLSRATSPYAGYGPGTLGQETFKAVSGIPEQPVGMAHGGDMGYSRGSSRESFAVNGPGTGRSDDIPAVLSDGEYVIDAETVALLGDGSSKAGAKKLDQMRVSIRKHKGKNLAKGKFSVNAKRPEAYMSGGRI